MGLEYIWLAPGFVKQVLEVYESWDGKQSLPMKVQELMMVLEVEVAKRYRPEHVPEVSPRPRSPRLKDVRLG